VLPRSPQFEDTLRVVQCIPCLKVDVALAGLGRQLFFAASIMELALDGEPRRVRRLASTWSIWDIIRGCTVEELAVCRSYPSGFAAGPWRQSAPTHTAEQLV